MIGEGVGVMRRRRYLQATAGVVAVGLAGCRDLGGDDATPAPRENPPNMVSTIDAMW